MTDVYKIQKDSEQLLNPIRDFLHRILELDEISAILTPLWLPMKNVVMPVLVNDPELLDRADPISPAFPMNAAKLACRLTRKPTGSKTVVLLRPCEIRAFTELVKLKQGSPDEITIIGLDCQGAFTNKDFSGFVAGNGQNSTEEFYNHAISTNNENSDLPNIAEACRACEHPVPDGADIIIGLYGLEDSDYFMVKAQTQKGKELVRELGLPEAEEPPNRNEKIKALFEKKAAFRKEMYAETEKLTSDLESLTSYLAGCVNCYNCRVACPVCYCRECVFTTDVFDHEPVQYQRWAVRKGGVKMPADTVFYHLTRMAHMSAACVGCGQCSNACPNDIKVMELFRLMADRTQNAFDYQAGRSLDEAPPLSEFREQEFSEVVGM